MVLQVKIDPVSRVVKQLKFIVPISLTYYFRWNESKCIEYSLKIKVVTYGADLPVSFSFEKLFYLIVFIGKSYELQHQIINSLPLIMLF